MPDDGNVSNIIKKKNSWIINEDMPDIIIQNKTIIILIVFFIIAIILFSLYEKYYDNGRLDKPYYEIILVNLLISIGGIIMGIIGNYFTEQYTLKRFDEKVNILSNIIIEKSKKIPTIKTNQISLDFSKNKPIN